MHKAERALADEHGSIKTGADWHQKLAPELAPEDQKTVVFCRDQRGD
jgi:hypothetical protein